MRNRKFRRTTRTKVSASVIYDIYIDGLVLGIDSITEFVYKNISRFSYGRVNGINSTYAGPSFYSFLTFDSPGDDVHV